MENHRKWIPKWSLKSSKIDEQIDAKKGSEKDR
jgi:hypothetical protein